jgi:hypothetical protein
MFRLTEPARAGRDDKGLRRGDREGQSDLLSCDVGSPLAAASKCSPARMLSAHEVAALLQLACTSVEPFAGTPDIFALMDLGLASVAQCTEGDRIVLTAQGQAVLRRLKVGGRP